MPGAANQTETAPEEQDQRRWLGNNGQGVDIQPFVPADDEDATTGDGSLEKAQGHPSRTCQAIILI